MTKIEQEFSSSAVVSSVSRSSSEFRTFTRDPMYTNSDMLKNNILNSWSNETESYEDENPEYETLCSDGDQAESQRLSLDSGFGPDGDEGDVDDENNEASEVEATSDRDDFDLTKTTYGVSPPETGHRKLQSILRAEPQVFIIRSDKKVVKKKSKVHNTPDSSSEVPRKSVEFLLPDGMKIPERGPVRKKNKSRIRVPIRHARRTFRHLKRKIIGRKSKVPVLPSIHSTHTFRQNQKKQQQGKVSVQKPKLLASPLFSRKNGKSRTKKTHGELVIKKSQNEEEETIKSTNPLVLGRVFVNTVDEDEEYETGTESDFQQHSDEDEIDNQISQYEEDQQDEETNQQDDSQHDSNDEEGDYPKLSRRKALGYHIRGLHQQQQQQQTHKRKVKKIKPTFPTAGHGVCHAQHIYPKPIPIATDNSQDCGSSKLNKKKNKKRLPFRYLNKKISSSSAENSNVDDNNIDKIIKGDNHNNANCSTTKDYDVSLSSIDNENESIPGQGSGAQQQPIRKDFNQKLVDFRSRILNNNDEQKVARRYSTPTSPKPGRIVNTRYRRDPSLCDEFPRWDF